MVRIVIGIPLALVGLLFLMAGIGGLSRKGELDAVGLAIAIVLSSFPMIPGLLFIYFGARHLRRRNKTIAQALSVLRETGSVSTAELAKEMKLSEAFVVRTLTLQQQKGIIPAGTLNLPVQTTVAYPFEPLKDSVNPVAFTSQKVAEFKGHDRKIFSLYISDDGKTAVSGGRDDMRVRAWEIPGGKCIADLEGHMDSVDCVQLSADGRFIISAGGHLHTGGEERLIPGLEFARRMANTAVGVNLIGRGFHGGKDKTLRLWDLSTSECVRVFEGHEQGVHAVCLSNDGRLALSGSGDTSLRLWDVSTGDCLRIFKRDIGDVRAVCFSPDESLALSGSDDGTVRLWQISTGDCLGVFKGHRGILFAVCFSGDGRLALSGSDDGTARLWDVSTGQCLHVLSGHESGAVDSVRFSVDGRFIESVGAHTLFFWETASGKCLQAIKLTEESYLAAKTLSNNGRFALLASISGTLQVWEIRTDRAEV